MVWGFRAMGCKVFKLYMFRDLVLFHFKAAGL